jgi:hypothetical protein
LLLLVGLSVTVGAERGDAGGREGHAAFRTDGLGRQGGEAACAGALEGAADAGGAVVEVEVSPAQAEEFALAESGAQGEFEQRVEAVALCEGEEGAGLVVVRGVKRRGPGVPVRTLRATLRGISSSRTACSRADLSTEWM